MTAISIRRALLVCAIALLHQQALAAPAGNPSMSSLGVGKAAPAPGNVDISGNALFTSTSQVRWGTGASASWAGNAVDTTTACPIGAPIQEGNFFSAHCYQFTTTPSFGSPQGGVVSTFVAGANTQGGGNEAVNLFLATYAQSGAPNTWTLSAESVFLPGSMGGPIAELDAVNESCDPGPALSPSPDCGALGHTFHGITIDGIGSNIPGVYPGNAAIKIEGSGTGPMWHDGIVFTGGDTMVDHNILDATNVPTSYEIFGTHSVGLDCFFGVVNSCLRLASGQRIVMNGSTGRDFHDNGSYLTTLGDFYPTGHAGTTDNLGTVNAPITDIAAGGALFGWNRSGGLKEADIVTFGPSGGGGVNFYDADNAGNLPAANAPFFSVTALGALTTPGPATHGVAASIVGAPGTTRALFYDSVVSGTNLTRWEVAANNGAESGGDAGSDLASCRFHDDGSLIDCPLIIQRATGGLTVQDGISFLSGRVSSSNTSMPTSDPHHLGQWWNNSGVINISGG